MKRAGESVKPEAKNPIGSHPNSLHKRFSFSSFSSALFITVLTAEIHMLMDVSIASSVVPGHEEGGLSRKRGRPRIVVRDEILEQRRLARQRTNANQPTSSLEDREGMKIALRLYVLKEKNQVVFAEANSDFVDTLFSFLTIPIGKIVRTLKTKCDLQAREFGCFGNLYETVENLDDSQIWSEGYKQMLLNPMNV
ncbi:hypothetical protein ACET3Z_005977 [Daucus carota]